MKMSLSQNLFGISQLAFITIYIIMLFLSIHPKKVDNATKTQGTTRNEKNKTLKGNENNPKQEIRKTSTTI